MFVVFFLFASFIISVVGITVLQRYAAKIGLLDYPGERKVHNTPTPLIGGIAVFLSLLYCWFFLQYIPGSSALASIPMLAAITLILVEGVWDDWHDSHARHRFLFHLLIAMIMVNGAGVGLYDLGNMFSDQIVHTGFWMTPLTIFAVAGGINAYNMIDGIDGLTGSLALVSLMGMIGLVFAGGLVTDLYFLTAFSGAIAGFLVFNMRTPWQKEARVFLGDSGSMLIGLLMAWLLTHLSQGDERVMQPVMALWFFAVPLFDAVGMIIRRILNNKSPLDADQEHVHHMLLKMGFSVQQTVGILVGISAVFVMTAIAADRLGIPQYYMFYAFLGLFLIYLYSTQRFWRAIKYTSEYTSSSVSKEKTV